jgi:tetratricopeptide (TPR) repeat protein
VYGCVSGTIFQYICGRKKTLTDPCNTTLFFRPLKFRILKIIRKAFPRFFAFSLSFPLETQKAMAFVKSSIAALCFFAAASAIATDDSAEIQRLLKAGNATEALKVSEQSLTAKPKDPELRFLRGVSLTELNRSGEAISTFVKLTEDFPELPEPFNNLAVLYAGQGQYDKARSALEMSIRTNPSYSTAYENLGDVYAKLASQAYAKALQIDGTNQAVPPKLGLIKELFSPKTTTAATPPSLLPTPTETAAVTPPAQPQTQGQASSSTSGTDSSGSKANTNTNTTFAETAEPSSPSLPAPNATTTPPSAENEISEAVKTWATAWSQRDITTYLGAYSKDFESGKPRSAWEAERKSRILNRSSIEVKISKLKVLTLNPRQAEVTFHQDYESGNIKSSSTKTLMMVKSGSRWLIQREASTS